jgi:hypothetical protein
MTCPRALRPALAGLELTDLVSQGLAGPGDVAVDLVLDLITGQCGVLRYVGERLIVCPLFVVQARVNNQPSTSQRVVVEPAKRSVRIGMKPDLAGQPLAVQGPNARPEWSTQ